VSCALPRVPHFGGPTCLRPLRLLLSILLPQVLYGRNGDKGLVRAQFVCLCDTAPRRTEAETDEKAHLRASLSENLPAALAINLILAAIWRLLDLTVSSQRFYLLQASSGSRAFQSRHCHDRSALKKILGAQ
jgi:hypothetical protein